tara:strand:- start:249 stop:650 length:402 start_codon:yes stop_codon:yes gene_type:complete
MKRIEPISVFVHHQNSVDGEDDPRTGFEIGQGRTDFGKSANNPYANKRVQYIKLVTDDSKDNSTEGLNIMLEIDTSQVFNESEEDKTSEFKDQSPQRNDGEIMTMRLRELDYCDADGNQQKILVFASEPYDVD